MEVCECSVVIDRLSMQNIRAMKAAIGKQGSLEEIEVEQIQDEHHYAKNERPLYHSKAVIFSVQDRKQAIIDSNESECANCDILEGDGDILLELVTDMDYGSH